MIKDQVRTARIGKAAPKSRRAAVPSRQARSRKKTDHKQNKHYTWLIILAIVVLLLGTLSYGLTTIFSFFTASDSSRISLIIVSSAGENQTHPLWLFVAGKKGQTQYFHIANQDIFSTGLIPDSGWMQLVEDARLDMSDSRQRSILSQRLGLPIEEVVHVEARSNSWNAIKTQLRSTAFDQLRQGNVSDGSVRSWLQARSAAGFSDSTALSAIINQLKRMNLAAIESKENCPMAVLNNTGRAGYASQVGKVIEQNGGTVVRVANALAVGELGSIDQQKTMIMMRPGTTQSCTNTLSLITVFFPQVSTMENMAIADQYRADAVLILGSEIASTDVTEVVPNLHQ